MTDRHFIVFNSVYKHLNMTLAANELFISQPAVSRYISDLENHYGAKLFAREKGKLVPTEKCKQLYEYTNRITSAMLQANRLFSSSQYENVFCNIGLIPAIAETIYPMILEKLYDIAPLINLKVMVSRSSEIISGLLSHDLDIAISDLSINHPMISSSPLFTSKQVPICARSAPYPDELTIEQLSKYPLLLKEKGTSGRTAFDSAMGSCGLIPNIIIESSSNSFLLQRCQEGKGISIVTGDLLKYHPLNKDFRIIAIKDYDIRRSFYLNFYEDILLDSYYKQLVTTISDTIQHLVKADIK